MSRTQALFQFNDTRHGPWAWGVVPFFILSGLGDQLLEHMVQILCAINPVSHTQFSAFPCSKADYPGFPLIVQQIGI
jgi:hypothetical protein